MCQGRTHLLKQHRDAMEIHWCAATYLLKKWKSYKKRSQKEAKIWTQGAS